MKIIVKRLSNVDKEELSKYLVKVDKDFSPALSDYHSDLIKYAEQLLEKGIVWLSIVDNQSVGMIAVYANDTENKNAYLAILSTIQQYRKLGVAQKMMTVLLEYLCTTKMQKIRVRSNNPSAIYLYKKNGFIESGEEYVKGKHKFWLECDINNKIL